MPLSTYCGKRWSEHFDPYYPQTTGKRHLTHKKRRTCLPSTSRLHRKINYKYTFEVFDIWLANFKDKGRELLEIIQNLQATQSHSPCIRLKKNKVSQFLHIKEMLPSKHELWNPKEAIKHKFKIQAFRYLHQPSPKQYACILWGAGRKY